MSDIISERYKLKAGVDRSFPALRQRLVKLQPALSQLMPKALELFDGVFPQAPHPSADSSVAYATATMNLCPMEGIPMGRELTIVLGAGKWVRIFRNTNSSPNAYPREQLWVFEPVQEAYQKIHVQKTHNPDRKDCPYDIEVLDYDEKGMHLGFVGGADYFEKERYIDEANSALDTARHIAENNGLFAPLS